VVRFRNTDDLRKYVVQIVDTDHENLGNWTTAQIFYHVAAAFEASVGATPLPLGFPRVLRWIIRPCRRLVTHVRFPPGLPIPAAIAFKLKPPPNPDLAEQYRRLLIAIDLFDEHTGPMPPHPVLGPLTRSEWIGFHLRHCEHHFSFIRLSDMAQSRNADSGTPIG